MAGQTRLAVPRAWQPPGQRNIIRQQLQRENSGCERAPPAFRRTPARALFLARRSSRICPYFGSFRVRVPQSSWHGSCPFVIGSDCRLLTLKRECLWTTTSASMLGDPPIDSLGQRPDATR